MSLGSGELKTLGLRSGYRCSLGEKLLWIGEIVLPPIGNGRLLGVELWPRSNSGLRRVLFCPVPILLLTERGGLLGRSRICVFFFFFVFVTTGLVSGEI